MIGEHKNNNSGVGQGDDELPRPVTVYGAECGDWTNRECSLREALVTTLVFSLFMIVMYITTH